MIFTIVFAGTADTASIFKFRGKLEQVEGIVVSSERSGYSEGGSRRKHGTGRSRRGTPIYRHDYTFQINGTAYQGVSYSKGGALESGQKIQVEFPQDQPTTSRIKGMRTAPFGTWVLLLSIFPLAGLALAVTGLFLGRKNCSLLARGELARGRLTAKEQTNSHVNRQNVYKLTFQYTDRKGHTHQATTKTHLPEKLEDDAEERLLYDPLHPDRAAFVDMLPATPKISEEGVISSVSTGRVLAAILPPIIAALIVICGLILKML